MTFDKAEWKSRYKDFIKKDTETCTCQICKGTGWFTYWDDEGNEIARECDCKLDNPFSKNS